MVLKAMHQCVLRDFNSCSLYLVGIRMLHTDEIIDLMAHWIFVYSKMPFYE